MRDAALDLFLGSRCAGCEVPGRMLCHRCRALLPGQARPAWPLPTPEGLVPPWAFAPYEGAVRALIVGHKDQGQWGHRRLLGAWLARAVSAGLAEVDPDVAVVLVPVPSRPGANRSRGYDPLGAIATDARRALRRIHRQVVVAPLLRSRGGVSDQAGLGATARSANVAWSLHCPGSRLRWLGQRVTRAHVVVCDDVITTGATAREAQRALEAVGVRPLAVAAVAATRRRHPGPPGDSTGLPSLSS